MVKSKYFLRPNSTVGWSQFSQEVENSDAYRGHAGKGIMTAVILLGSHQGPGTALPAWLTSPLTNLQREATWGAGEMGRHVDGLGCGEQESTQPVRRPTAASRKGGPGGVKGFDSPRSQESRFFLNTKPPNFSLWPTSSIFMSNADCSSNKSHLGAGLGQQGLQALVF